MLAQRKDMIRVYPSCFIESNVLIKFDHRMEALLRRSGPMRLSTISRSPAIVFPDDLVDCKSANFGLAVDSSVRDGDLTNDGIVGFEDFFYGPRFLCCAKCRIAPA